MYPRNNLLDFGAVNDGTFDPITKRMTGTDNTQAINRALASGRTIAIPRGLFYYTGPLTTAVHGSGLMGSGSWLSHLITDQSHDYHITVSPGTRGTHWSSFGMIGPFATNSGTLNRALVIGGEPFSRALAAEPWNAAGTWIDDFVTYGYRVGVHIASGANVEFGTIEVYEAGDSRAEPGAYGISCSGSNLRGRRLRAVNTTTRARHALYYTGPANNCFVDLVEATGFDFAAVQNRCTQGGGRGNGFAKGHFEDCNTNSLVEPVSELRGVVNFHNANDRVVKGAGWARIGDYAAINCGGFPGPSLRFMPNSRCGTVRILAQANAVAAKTESDIHGSHIYHSDNVQLPLLVFLGGFEYLQSDKLLVVEDSSDCYGGGVRVVSP